jgi:hypothetical protein
MSEAVIRTRQIADKILILRGQKVLFDRDLATPDGVETRVLQQAFERHAARLREEFLYSLRPAEIVRQIVRSSADVKFSKTVCAFTEQGDAMPLRSRRRR